MIEHDIKLTQAADGQWWLEVDADITIVGPNHDAMRSLESLAWESMDAFEFVADTFLELIEDPDSGTNEMTLQVIVDLLSQWASMSSWIQR